MKQEEGASVHDSWEAERERMSEGEQIATNRGKVVKNGRWKNEPFGISQD